MPRFPNRHRHAALLPPLGMRSGGSRWNSIPVAASLPGRTALSASLHVLAVIVLANAWWVGTPHLRPAGTSTGQHVMVTYNPGKPTPPSPPRIATRHRYPTATPALAVQQDAKVVPAPQGNDALGSGAVSLLYVQAFPGQRPDLSGAGVTGDVVVDVEIDDTGHVARVHTRQGMGAQIDDLVVATVERWIFHPALRDGVAVRSARELRFHFDRRRNSNCGWECFALEE